MKYVDFDYRAFKVDRSEICSTLGELAEKTGISYQILRNIEGNRRKVTFEDIAEICKPIGLDPKDYIKVKPPKIITVLTNKGGAGKTSVAVNLAAALVFDFKKKVLVIDTDLQQNTTMHLGMSYPTSEDEEEVLRMKKVFEDTKTKNIYNCFYNDEDIHKHIQHTRWKNLDIVPSVDAMSQMDKDIFYMQLGELRMQSILSRMVDENPFGYEYVIIDCNPTLSRFNESVLFGTDFLLIPLEASAFGLRGVSYVLNFYEGVKKKHKELQLLGIVLNKYDIRKNITKDITEVMESNSAIRDKLFETKIPIDTSLEQAQGYGEPVFITAPKSRASKVYKELAKEVLEKTEPTEPTETEE